MDGCHLDFKGSISKPASIVAVTADNVTNLARVVFSRPIDGTTLDPLALEFGPFPQSAVLFDSQESPTVVVFQSPSVIGLPGTWELTAAWPQVEFPASGTLEESPH